MLVFLVDIQMMSTFQKYRLFDVLKQFKNLKNFDKFYERCNRTDQQVDNIFKLVVVTSDDMFIIPACIKFVKLNVLMTSLAETRPY